LRCRRADCAVSSRARIAPRPGLGTNDRGSHDHREPLGARRRPSISANRREPRAHPRAIQNPARRRLAPPGDGLTRPAGGEQSRNCAHRSCRSVRARTWLCGGPNEPATGTSRRGGLRGRRLENRRRRNPGQDRLTERRANVRTGGEVEVPSSRRQVEPKPGPSLAPEGGRNAFFATARRVPSTGARDQWRQ
jgi:hypothetical protein